MYKFSLWEKWIKTYEKKKKKKKKLYIDINEIKRVQSRKYLGVVIDQYKL